MAKNTGTLVTSPIRPNDDRDKYPSAHADEIKGGHHSAATLTERDAITSQRRVAGMTCYVASNNITYTLAANLTSWTLHVPAGGAAPKINWEDSPYQPAGTSPVPLNGDMLNRVVWLTGKTVNFASDPSNLLEAVPGDYIALVGPGTATHSLVNSTITLLENETAVRYFTGNSWIIISSHKTPAPSSSGGGAVSSVAGRTGDVSLTKADVGLGNVDNTSDLGKPLSTAATNALSGKAATAHTHTAANVTDFAAAADARITVQKAKANGLATLGSDLKVPSSQLPTATAGVTVIDNLTSSDTSAALAASQGKALKLLIDGKASTSHSHSKSDVGLGNVDNTSDLSKPLSTAATNALGNKVDKVSGKGLSTNDYDGTEKTKVTNATSKLSGIATGASKNAADAQLRDRSTHTGEQLISTITDLRFELDKKEATGGMVVSGTHTPDLRGVYKLNPEAPYIQYQRGTGFGSPVIAWLPEMGPDNVNGKWTINSLWTSETTNLNTTPTPHRVTTWTPSGGATGNIKVTSEGLTIDSILNLQDELDGKMPAVFPDVDGTTPPANTIGFVDGKPVWGDNVKLNGNAFWGDGDSYRTASGTESDAVANGTALKVAYAAAKALTPNGAALSATNRACVLIYPGRYDLVAASNTNGLTLDTEFVDLVGIGAREDIFITSVGRTVAQTANDVLIQGVTLESASSASKNFNATDDAAYFPDTDLPLAKMEDVVCVGSNNGWGHRLGVDFSGTYVGCVAGDYSFGGDGTFSGTAINCVGGNESFGSYGTFSGTATNCVSGFASFACDGTFSGTATNCVAKDSSFGGTGVFGGTLSGKLYSCRLTNGDFQTVSGVGITRNCLNGDNVADNQG